MALFRMRQAFTEAMNQFKTRPNPQFPYSIVTFDSPSSVEPWQVLSDQQIGGKSEAEFKFDQENEMAHFSGQLSLDVQGTHLSRSGYGAIISQPFLAPLQLWGFNAFQLDVESDGRTFVMNVTPTILGDTLQLYQCMFKVPANERGKVILPFSDFGFTRNGGVSDDQRDLCGGTRIHSVGFLMAERKEGPFSLKIRNISAIRIRNKRYDPGDDEYDEQDI